MGHFGSIERSGVAQRDRWDGEERGLLRAAGGRKLAGVGDWLQLGAQRGGLHDVGPPAVGWARCVGATHGGPGEQRDSEKGGDSEPSRGWRQCGAKKAWLHPCNLWENRRIFVSLKLAIGSESMRLNLREALERFTYKISSYYQDFRQPR